MEARAGLMSQMKLFHSWKLPRCGSYTDGHFLRPLGEGAWQSSARPILALQLRQAGLGDSTGGKKGLRALFTLAGVQAQE